MKAKMKKLISIKSIPILALALLIVLGSALAAARDPVTIYGSDVDLTAPDGPFGKATLTIRGDEFMGTVLVIMGAVEPRSDGLYAPAAVHIFDFGDDGGFTTVGAEYLVPTDFEGQFSG